MSRLRLALILLTGAPSWTPSQSEPWFREVYVESLSPKTRRVVVCAPGEIAVGPGSFLTLVSGGTPCAWGEFIESEDGRAVFGLVSEPVVSASPQNWHAWLAPPDLIGKARSRWPAGASLEAEVDSLGPGGSSAWIRAGSQAGVCLGDSWWLLVGGQPAARCDVRFVAPALCFCTVVPLANEPALRPGVRVSLWPSPWERRTGRAHSAVSYVEQRSNSSLVWVAAPMGVACPTEPHLDFFHDRRYIGHGTVERRDTRFWYARFAPSVAASAVRVGDEVVIRTQQDIDEQRVVARVFEVSIPGALIDAGEGDGIRAEQTLFVQRAGQMLGRAVATAVASTYARVEPSRALDEDPFELRVGDELRLIPPRPAPTVVGTVEDVVGGAFFRARIVAPLPALDAPLAVRAAGRTIGVAVLVVADGASAVGLVLPGTGAGVLAGGQELVQAE